MKVVQINSVCKSGSTGKICISISKLLTSYGIENYIFHVEDECQYSLGKQYMSSFQVKVQAIKAKFFGNYGFQSKNATYKLIKELEKITPDIVQLHNLHGHNVHLGVLFSYLKEKKIKTFWTFHDCFAFVSYCMYFDMAKCDKWKNGCRQCPQRKKYSWFVDRSSSLYKKKKELFSGLDLTIITPSQWLSGLVKQSFLGDYPVKIIHNGIDLSLFSPRKSNFREKYGISSQQKVLLGIANKWEKRKGLDVFLHLVERLDKEKYKIVLVGTNDKIDMQLPSEIISIHRTVNQHELAEIYSAADYFVNPTREDNFPTVNLESIACGTPVITFNTGGSPEALSETSGIVIEQDDFNELCKVIESENDFLTKENCLERATHFNQDDKYKEYIDLYRLSRI